MGLLAGIFFVLCILKLMTVSLWCARGVEEAFPLYPHVPLFITIVCEL